MNDIAVVLITVDRAPAENYLETTMANLKRAGVFDSPYLDSFHIVDSGRTVEGTEQWPDRAVINQVYQQPSVSGSYEHDSRPALYVHHTDMPRSGKQNCAAALRIGARTGAAWVLQLEDDLDVIDDFLGSAARWIETHATADRVVYPLSGDNAAIAHAVRQGGDSWEYPVAWFWGFQAFLVRPETALDLAQWFEDHPVYTHDDGRKDENAHDLEIHHWAAARGVEFFRGSAPSFVQHIGHVTSVPGNVMGGKRVVFPSWPGPLWTYKRRRNH